MSESSVKRRKGRLNTWIDVLREARGEMYKLAEIAYLRGIGLSELAAACAPPFEQHNLKNSFLAANPQPRTVERIRDGIAAVQEARGSKELLSFLTMQAEYKNAIRYSNYKMLESQTLETTVSRVEGDRVFITFNGREELAVLDDSVTGWRVGAKIMCRINAVTKGALGFPLLDLSLVRE